MPSLDHELEKVGIHRDVKEVTKNGNSFLRDETKNKIHCLYYVIVDLNRMVATHVDSFSYLLPTQRKIQSSSNDEIEFVEENRYFSSNIKIFKKFAMVFSKNTKLCKIG